MNGRTPAPVNQEGALDFEDRPKAKPQINAVIHLAYSGVPIDITVASDRETIEKMIKNLLKSDWTAPPLPKAGGFGGGNKDNRIDPAFDDNGDEICPIHRVKVRTYEGKDGRPSFKGCPSKGTGAQGEKLNERGYCSARFK